MKFTKKTGRPSTSSLISASVSSTTVMKRKEVPGSQVSSVTANGTVTTAPASLRDTSPNICDLGPKSYLIWLFP